MLDQLIGLFQSSAGGWAPSLLGYATTLFGGLALIEFVWVVGFSLARRAELPDLIATIIQQIITIGFFYWLMRNSPEFLKAIIDSFRIAASGASMSTGGSANMSPSDVFNAGLNLARAVWQGMTWDHPLLGILLALSGLITVVVFAGLTAMMIEVLIETLFVSYAGVIMMGFGGNTYTRQYAVAQFRYAISVGVKLLVLQLIVGLGEHLVVGWATTLSAAGAVTDWTTVGMMIGAPIVLARIAIKLPQIAQDIAQDMVMGNITGAYGSLGSTAAMVASAAGAGALAIAGTGAAALSAMKLTGRQMEQRLASAAAGGSDGQNGGGQQPGRMTQAAMMTGMAARNLAAGFAGDVGRRLTGQPGATQGSTPWRVASALNQQAKGRR